MVWPTPTAPRPHDTENTAGQYFPSQNQKDLVWADRAQAILSVPGLAASDLDIHLLGCWGDDPTEAFRTAAALPDGRVRGIDSGIAAIYAQSGRELMRGPSSRGRPGHHLDFTRDYDPVQRGLLVSNIQRWKRAVRTGV